MMRLPSTGWEKMSTFLEIYLICIINACSYGFLVACEHLWHAWNALVRLFQRIYQAPYPPLFLRLRDWPILTGTHCRLPRVNIRLSL